MFRFVLILVAVVAGFPALSQEAQAQGPFARARDRVEANRDLVRALAAEDVARREDLADSLNNRSQPFRSSCQHSQAFTAPAAFFAAPPVAQALFVPAAPAAAFTAPPSSAYFIAPAPAQAFTAPAPLFMATPAFLVPAFPAQAFTAPSGCH